MNVKIDEINFSMNVAQKHFIYYLVHHLVKVLAFMAIVVLFYCKI